MTSLERPDGKADFYLRHWRQIEEWAALRAEAATLLDTALRELPDLVSWRAPRGTQVVGVDVHAGRFPRVELTCPDWQATDLELCLAVEWNSGELLRAGAPGRWPYVGVRMATTRREHAPARTAIRRACADPALALGIGQSSAFWPCWDYVPAPEPLAPEPYAASIADGLTSLWSRLAGPIDAVLSEMPVRHKVSAR